MLLTFLTTFAFTGAGEVGTRTGAGIAIGIGFLLALGIPDLPLISEPAPSRIELFLVIAGLTALLFFPYAYIKLAELPLCL